jgi:glutamate--cysteine ligase
VTLVEWSSEILDECAPIAAALDAANGSHAHREALASALAAVNNSAATPSARVLEAMARDHANSYAQFVLAQSLAHRDDILEMPFPDEVAERFARLADESITEQRRIEATDTLPFETYRQLYLAAFRLDE